MQPEGTKFSGFIYYKMTNDRRTFLTGAKDYILIAFGLLLYAVGFTALILPYGIVMGGLTGVGTLVYFASDRFIPVAVTSYACNLTLLTIAYRIVGKQFVLKTLYGATLAALFIGIFQPVFMSLSHPLILDRPMSIILGGILCGLGVGITFIHNGSSGGTDIVAAMVSKKSNVSVGRTMIYVDMTIVSLSILLPFDGSFTERLEARVPVIVYGLLITYLIAFITDMLINTNRQATQFIIFSHRWREIADAVNREAHRGVTILDGMGWYSKQQVRIVMVWCRKIESVTIFRIIKSIDPEAFITQTMTNGVYGKGFDTMKIKVKRRPQTPPPAQPEGSFSLSDLENPATGDMSHLHPHLPEHRNETETGDAVR